MSEGSIIFPRSGGYNGTAGMANKSRGTWFVTYEVPKGPTSTGRRSSRATKTFQDEQAAKEFAQKQFAEGLNVNAGTISPHVPRQAIASTKIRGWFKES
jgi:hypothetical protein